MLHVSRGHRRRGVATALFEEVRWLVRRDRATHLDVFATPSELAVAFYLNCGFLPTDAPDPGLLAEEPEDIHMVLRIQDPEAAHSGRRGRRLEEDDEEVSMNWKALLERQAEDAYRAAEGLLALVEDQMLGWKPTSGSNWMTTGQLLSHLTGACGAMCKGFAIGDWGTPAEPSDDAGAAVDMLPPAEKLPAVRSVAEAARGLAADKALTFETLKATSEEELSGRRMSAPWDPTERPLGEWLAQSIEHLASHKAQLFYYLKLQGLPVNTGHLWGM